MHASLQAMCVSADLSAWAGRVVDRNNMDEEYLTEWKLDKLYMFYSTQHVNGGSFLELNTIYWLFWGDDYGRGVIKYNKVRVAWASTIRYSCHW